MLSAIEQLTAAAIPRPRRRPRGWIHEGSVTDRVLSLMSDNKVWTVGRLLTDLPDCKRRVVRRALYRLDHKRLVAKVGVEPRDHNGPERPTYRKTRKGRL